MERGRGGGDGDTRVAACGLEYEVHLRGTVGGDDDVIRLGRCKASGGRLDSVGIRDEAQDGVVAVSVGLHGLRSPFAYICNYNGCIRYYRAGGVGSGADDGAEDGLCLHALPLANSAATIRTSSSGPSDRWTLRDIFLHCEEGDCDWGYGRVIERVWKMVLSIIVDMAVYVPPGKELRAALFHRLG